MNLNPDKPYLFWCEPFAYIKGETLSQVVRVTKTDVVKAQAHRHPDNFVIGDPDCERKALQDFIIVYGAWEGRADEWAVTG